MLGLEAMIDFGRSSDSGATTAGQAPRSEAAGEADDDKLENFNFDTGVVITSSTSSRRTREADSSEQQDTMLEQCADSIDTWPPLGDLVSSLWRYSLAPIADVHTKLQRAGSGDDDEYMVTLPGETKDKQDTCSSSSTNNATTAGDDADSALENEQSPATASTFSAADLYGIPDLIAKKVGESRGREILRISECLKASLFTSGRDFGPSPGSLSADACVSSHLSGAAMGVDLLHPWWLQESDSTLHQWSEGELCRRVGFPRVAAQ